MFGGGGGRQQFSVSRIVEGVHYKSDEQIMVEELVVGFTGLLEWVRPAGVEMAINYSEQVGFSSFKLTSKRIPEDVIQIHDGEVAIEHDVRNIEHRLEGYSLRQAVRAAFRFRSAMEIDDALDYASDLQDLLTIGTDRIVGFDDVSFRHADFDVDVGNGRTFRESATLHAKWRVRVPGDQTTREPDDMAFTYDDLGGSSGLEQWFVMAHTFRSQIGRVVNSRYNESMFLQDVLLARMASLESLDKAQSGGSITLAARLDRLIGYAGQPFRALFGSGADGGSMTVWRDKAKDQRNDAAHHLGRNLRSDIAELYFVSEAAYWLFVICILRICSAPPAVFDRIQANRRFRWTGEELESFLQ
jgi:hypothetical protein